MMIECFGTFVVAWKMLFGSNFTAEIFSILFPKDEDERSQEWPILEIRRQHGIEFDWASNYRIIKSLYIYVHTLCLRTLQIDDCNHGNCNLNLIPKILKSSWCHSCSTNTLQTQVKTQIFMGMLNAHGHDVTHARKTGYLAIIMPRRSLHCIEIQKGDERWFIHNFKDQFHHLFP